MSEKEWFILPGLKDVFLRFVSIARDYLSEKPLINNSPIMIIGDSGVGKSAFIEAARQIFAKNNNLTMNKDGFYDKIKRINCASFSAELADSEIFGHEKGAFTGAVADKKGIVDVANGGLLILDEMGDLSEEVQAKLLIFIEEGEYRRLGGSEIKRAKLKIIGTTNINYEKFRNDFWFRFNPVFVPAMYQRRLDVIYYIFLKYPSILKRFTSQHALSLLAHNWPGNVREIERVVSAILSEDKLHYWKGKEYAPFVLELDKRQTDLVNIHIEEFSKKLVNSGFDLVLLNSIISRYGLQIPYSFSSFNELDIIKKNTRLGDNRLDTESFVVENLFRDDSELESPIDVSADIVYDPNGIRDKKYKRKSEGFEGAFCYASRKYVLEHMLLSIKNYLNMKNNFYLSGDFEDIHFYDSANELSGFKFIAENYKVEMIGSCFSAICNIFLRNSYSDKNVFDMLSNYVDEYWVNDLQEREIMEDFGRVGLIESALHFVIGRDAIIKKYDNSHGWGRYVKSIQLKSNESSSGEGCLSENDNFETRLVSYSEEELLIFYYKLLLKMYKKDVDVFKHADVNKSTCRHRLERFGLLPRLKKDGIE